MTDDTRLDALDIRLVEAEARRMRAEVARKMFSALVRSVSGLFAHKAADRTA